MTARACPSCHNAVEGNPPFCPSCGAVMPRDATPDPLIGRTFAGKYKIVELLGEGGMGCVYIGEQMLGTKARKVAVKTLHQHLSRDEKVRARFQREVGTLAGLEHPNTVQVYDFGTTEDGVLFIVMEFVLGRSIASVLEQERSMAALRVEKILAQMCGSLAEAHAQGIIHRDLKPDNVILTDRAGQKDFVKVLDFGIAKRGGEEDRNEAKLTQQGMVLGTPPYMSPEQFTGQPLDARSDIYSLAVMAYEMLTGQLPFNAQSAWEWATLHMTAAPVAIEATPNGAALPESMRAAIMRALSKAKEQRFSSVTEFLERFTGKTGASAADAPNYQPTAATPSKPPMAGTAGMSDVAMPPNARVPTAMGDAPKMQTQIGEPMAFPPGAFGPSPQAPPYGAPPHGAPPAYAAPAFATPGGVPQSVPTQARGGGGPNKGLILGIAGVVALISIAAIAIGSGAFKSSSSGSPVVEPLPTIAPTDTTTPAAPTDTTTAPPTPGVPPPLNAPGNTPPAPGPAPKPTTKPTTPPAAPTPTPTPTPKPPTPPAPTPTPTPPPAPTPTPPPAPTPTPPPAPTPKPPTPKPEPAICAVARAARGNKPPAVVASLETQCRALGGTP